jgi:two-component system, OmpR family, sensor histidine kinase KdpD
MMRGHLKVFLGYASGVGKSFRMLDEARRRHERGQDVVVAGVQRVMAPEVAEVLARLETIPAAPGDAIDVEAVIRRAPTVCVIDGLAYDNPAGARNPCRWQDVREIVEAGVKVIASINVQYVAELRTQVEAITRKRVAETVPLAFLYTADEVEIVDAPAGRAAELGKLREIALVLAADIVDRQLVAYLEENGVRAPLPAHERILLCLTPRANATTMIEAGALVARRFHGELMAAYVRQPQLSDADRQALDEKLAAARQAGASVAMLEGEDPVEAIVEYANEHAVTQLFIGHSQRSGMWARIHGNPVDRLIRRSRGMDVRVFPQ